MQVCHVVLGCAIGVVFLAVVCLPSAAGDDVIIQKRVYPSEMERMLDPKRKRPFCNAFTGCGKKRADESMGTLVELNSEPAVEELSRQIMSEAKLWEAIQEARLELLRRRQQQQLQPNQLSDRPTPFTGYRKKRAVDRVPDTKMQVHGKSIPWAR